MGKHNIVLLLILLPFLCPAQDNKPSFSDPSLEQRGNQGMGFDQQKITHHFLLTKDGGVIQVSANSPDDKTSIDQIRMHLEHIAGAFASGDFNIPMFVHDQTPPGVDVMKRLRKKMFYKVQFTDAGGRVLIGTANPKARQAIWDFLRFQIREHKTGDPL
ncbi:MAG TPA: hypothetical protein VKE71_02960 [Candidatus Angelobacter sp.]|nr:hypothetical protein [Candidatus Angelobacter sp.]